MIYPVKVLAKTKESTRRINIYRKLALKHNIEKGDTLLLVDRSDGILIVSKKEYLKN